MMNTARYRLEMLDGEIKLAKQLIAGLETINTLKPEKEWSAEQKRNYIRDKLCENAKFGKLSNKWKVERKDYFLRDNLNKTFHYVFFALKDIYNIIRNQIKSDLKSQHYDLIRVAIHILSGENERHQQKERETLKAEIIGTANKAGGKDFWNLEENVLPQYGALDTIKGDGLEEKISNYRRTIRKRGGYDFKYLKVWQAIFRASIYPIISQAPFFEFEIDNPSNEDGDSNEKIKLGFYSPKISFAFFDLLQYERALRKYEYFKNRNTFDLIVDELDYRMRELAKNKQLMLDFANSQETAYEKKYRWQVLGLVPEEEKPQPKIGAKSKIARVKF